MAPEQEKMLRKRMICASTKRSAGSRDEFEKLVAKDIPRWSSMWSSLLEGSKELRKHESMTEKPTDLQIKIQRKVSELIDKEEALVNLYMKAAETAKRKEEEFNCKIAILMQQIEKDRDLIKIIQRV